MRLAVLFTFLAAFSLNAFSQIKADDLDGNNTSACYTTGGYCLKPFQPMTNTNVMPAEPADTYNIVPGNVNKSSLKNLFYSPTTTQATKDATKVFAHLLGWFCYSTDPTCEGHVQVGYNSNDPATISAQITDMTQRSFDGVVLDWYGDGTRQLNSDPNDPSIPSIQRINDVASKLKTELQNRCGTQSPCPFQFALMEDQSAWKAICNNNATCIQTSLIQDISLANSNYFSSSAYARVGGRPILFFFISEPDFFTSTDWDTQWAQIWPQVANAATSLGNPLLVFRDAVGFDGVYKNDHPNSNGAYAWVNCNGDIRNLTDPKCNVNDPYGFLYLRGFYYKAMNEPVDQQRWGAAWKGYDKSNSAFQQSNIARLPQQCGQTWLKTLRMMTLNSDGTSNNYFGDGHPLNFVQLATWNDYDEGTEIETGISNCLYARSGGLLAAPYTLLKWNMYTQFAGTATLDTLDHFEIYYEPTDTGGNNLTKLVDVPVNYSTPGVPLPDVVGRRGDHSCPAPYACMEYDFSYDATSFVSMHPHYIYYVYAVAKPGMTNTLTMGFSDHAVSTRPPRPPR